MPVRWVILGRPLLASNLQGSSSAQLYPGAPSAASPPMIRVPLLFSPLSYLQGCPALAVHQSYVHQDSPRVNLAMRPPRSGRSATVAGVVPLMIPPGPRPQRAGRSPSQVRLSAGMPRFYAVSRWPLLASPSAVMAPHRLSDSPTARARDPSSRAHPVVRPLPPRPLYREAAVDIRSASAAPAGPNRLSSVLLSL